MRDYSQVISSGQTNTLDGLARVGEGGLQFLNLHERAPFFLESGESLSPLTIAYETYGRLNPSGDNVVLICHALTGSAHAAGRNGGEEADPGWWDPLIGQGKPFDTDRYFVVCSNILGSCYGTTGPVSINPRTGERFRNAFPSVTVRDIVRVQKLLIDALGISSLAAVCGSSLGGMQCLEWAVLYPELVRTIIPISASAAQSAWCIALNAIARAAITGDAAWCEGNYGSQPAAGLGIARMIGMVSYRSAQELEDRFGRARQEGDRREFFQVESYLRYQGEKLVQRFDANTYLTLSRATDSHDLGRGRGPVLDVLAAIKARTICIGVSSDLRYPPREQVLLARSIPDARYAEIQSVHGHDAFLIEYGQLGGMITGFLAEQEQTTNRNGGAQ